MSEGRFKKYLLYAIGEIVLVVIGILIALSINNWNQNKHERKYEAIMLREILSALNQDIQTMNNSLNYLHSVQQHIRALAIIKNDSAISTDSISYHFQIAQKAGIAVAFNSSPYQSIKSSGLNKISDPTLRSNLTLLYEKQLKSVEGWINEIIREQLYDKSDFLRENFEIKAYPDSINGIKTEYVIQPETICKNPKFDMFLYLTGGFIPQAKEQIEYAIKVMTDVKEEIETELNQ